LLLLLLASLLIIFFGILKINEPQYSFILTRQWLTHIHRYGQWRISWQNILRIDQINLTQGIEQLTLPYLGIKLKQLTAISEHISPRLANRLLHEQRELVMLCLQLKLIDYQQSHINFSPFALNNTMVSGPLAAWLHRSELLHQVLGFHLYIPCSALDRDSLDFIRLLRQCQQCAADEPAQTEAQD
jgi:hypothetical protein